MSYHRYTKADLEKIVCCQLGNLGAMHDLLRTMKIQNELLENANNKLSDELSEFKNKQVKHPSINLFCILMGCVTILFSSTPLIFLSSRFKQYPSTL